MLKHWRRTQQNLTKMFANPDIIYKENSRSVHAVTENSVLPINAADEEIVWF